MKRLIMENDYFYYEISKVINEVLDFKNIETYKITKTHEGYEFRADINDKLTLVNVFCTEGFDSFYFRIPIQANPESEIVNFGFEIGDELVTSQYAKTHYKDFVRIVATVGKCLKMYIDENDPDIIMFFSDSKAGTNGIDPQKDNYYLMAIRKNQPNGYNLGKIFDKKQNKSGICLFKNKGS